ncbi:PH domain-containing protein, partial [Candidatus Saccharibacteria bacterium]|nr:PH domain-containing protein [Candidatus Saccharibacteria bacterium]
HSVNEYPQLDLESDEYVLIDVKRHPIALALIWAAEAFLAVCLIAVWFVIVVAGSNSLMPTGTTTKSYISLIAICVLGFLVLAGFVSSYVFKNNKLFITNKRAIQQIVGSLFFRQNQEINLRMIEDVSFKQSGVLQYMFNYGTVRMSTVGDENTYTFTCAKNPQDQAREMGKIVEKIRQSTPETLSDGRS